MNHPLPIASEDVPLPAGVCGASGRQWSLRDANSRDVATMVQKLALDHQLARLLSARGVAPEDALAYLNPTLREAMPDPYVLVDMKRAAERIAAAVISGEGIGVFGDYDVDGTTASALLKRYFAALGVDIHIYLPDRMAEGYGPSADAFLSLKDAGARLVITVDCGASAHDAIEAAAAQGLDIVVLDHHLMNGPPPAGAAATVNPNRPDDVSGLTNMSAAGVAFLAVAAVNRVLREKGFFESRPAPDLMALLDLAALGLVCDVMPMTGLARVIVAQGLKVLGMRRNAGLAALAERAGAKGEPTAYHLGFLLGPRINAAGRIGHARLAFELLTADDPARARDLAERLHVMNAERQAIEADVQAQALAQIDDRNLDKDSIIVAAGEGWHPGVVGIVAGRLKEKFDKPVFVIGVENGVGKGSGRSLAGVDIGAAVAAAKNDGLLIAGGGHMMAAGLTASEGAIEEFRRRINTELGDAVARARASRSLFIDAVIGAEAVTRPFAELVSQAGPFGPENPEPVFALCALRVVETRRVGSDHIAATLENGAGTRLRAIAFRAADEALGALLQNAERLHLAGKIRPDDWRGGEAGQLHVTDAAPAA